MDLNLNDVKEFLLGAIAMGDMIAALFFFRYWTVTGDRLFLYFAASFVGNTISWLLLAGRLVYSEAEPLAYIVRLVAYVVILLGIIDKNRMPLGRALFQRKRPAA